MGLDLDDREFAAAWAGALHLGQEIARIRAYLTGATS